MRSPVGICPTVSKRCDDPAGPPGLRGIRCGNLPELAGVESSSLIAAVSGGLFEIYFTVGLIVRGFATQPAGTRAASASASA